MGGLGFLLAIGWRAQGQAQVDRVERRAQLATVVEARQATIGRLEQRLSDLREQLDDVVARTGERDLQRLRDRAAALGALSGTSPIDGPGLVVELADAAGARRADPNDADLLIRDVDLQAVVNALWRAGAEAIAIDGQRIVSTSSIRNAGAVVRLNYRVLTSPYRVEAIGDPAVMRPSFEASEIANSFVEWVTTYHLGFTVSDAERLELPGYQGSIRFRYATPIEDG